ncbi:Retrovirus-related Pol polyprotein from transposon RE1 [Sesamum angolense]|uniref:Retrovirus-related Pol polyprotein from transposon RE1 n=1 Tax=Sesamum angolense TaxID=2727404 RepID=A0AAE1W3J4_9LAMI|nr:Retrovirus-related Pol polyprotein from transposon RE1 [Sesamum angolense]
MSKSVTVRLLLGVAISKGWPLLQLDVDNAFLNGYLDKEVYMTPPKRYNKVLPGQVFTLKCSLYGLKQASRQWNIELTMRLQQYGVIQSSHDNCLFIQAKEQSFTIILVYVDDILSTGNT